MTAADLTLIAVLVDRSWSMTHCREEMEGGLNDLIDKQRGEPGRAEVALAQFDHEYEFVWRPQPLEQVVKYSLAPRGNTALLDAMGDFIKDIGKNLAGRPEAERPGKVIVCVVTDGEENSSRRYRRADIKGLVERQQGLYQWEFMFLGANIDAVSEASNLGIRREHALTFNTANAGITYAAASNYIATSRAGNLAAFSDTDREAALK